MCTYKCPQPVSVSYSNTGVSAGDPSRPLYRNTHTHNRGSEHSSPYHNSCSTSKNRFSGQLVFKYKTDTPYLKSRRSENGNFADAHDGNLVSTPKNRWETHCDWWVDQYITITGLKWHIYNSLHQHNKNKYTKPGLIVIIFVWFGVSIRFSRRDQSNAQNFNI